MGSIVMVITDRCDQACAFCYATHQKNEELTLDEIGDVLDQAAALGALKLELTGGDVYRRKDLHEILELARAKRFAVSIKTHGMHIDKAEAAALKALSVRRVDLSVHGADDATHDRVTRVPGSFQRTKSAAHYLDEVGIDVHINFVGTRYNLPQLPRVRELFAERFATATSFSITARDNEDTSSMAHQAEHEVMVVAQHYTLCQSSAPLVPPKDKEDHQRLCGAGHTGVAILPGGQVQPCPVYSRPMGNVRERSLAEIWSGEVADQVRAHDWGKNSGCSGCEAKSHCSFCPAGAYLAVGDATQPVASNCGPAFAMMEGFEKALADRKIASE
jgi:radical SAM protein with 4Fe4S-binding SPASM domain